MYGLQLSHDIRQTISAVGSLSPTLPSAELAPSNQGPHPAYIVVVLHFLVNQHYASPASIVVVRRFLANHHYLRKWFRAKNSVGLLIFQNQHYPRPKTIVLVRLFFPNQHDYPPKTRVVICHISQITTTSGRSPYPLQISHHQS